MIKKALTALVLSGAFASAHADVILQQGFDNINSLAGWVRTNVSTPGGLTPGWYQGDQSIFGSHSGAPESYLAANYNNAAAGGDLSNWLITPVFSTSASVDVSVWLKGLDTPDYFDQVAFGFSNGSSAIADFNLNPVITVGTNGWSLYTVHLEGQGTGSTARFAIQYTGKADSANYIGVDDLSINRIPEPASMLLMATGLIGLAAARRRRPRG